MDSPDTFMQQALALAGQAVGFAVCLYLAWVGLHMTLEAVASHERSLGISQAPEWPKYAAMPIGMGLTALQYVAEIARTLAGPTQPGTLPS